jgi:hypothetical protein
MLALGGPLLCSHDTYAALERWSPDDVALVRAELLAFLRSLVGRRGTDRFSQGIGTLHPVTFSAVASGGSVHPFVEGDVRDVLVLQFVTLLQVVGIESVRACRAPECGRLFVRRYRREYCSRRCQNREFMQLKRAEERADALVEQKRRRVR